MKYDFDDLYEGPRFQKKARKRKINLIINSMIVIVSIAIIMTVINIFLDEKEEVDVALQENNGAEQLVDNEAEEASDYESEVGSSVNTETEIESSANPTGTSKDQVAEPPSSTVAASNPEGNEALVIGTLENDWKPIGTSQTGEHVINFTKDSQDWKEMTEAASVATGLPKDGMIVWWMGNGGGSNKVVSTVSSKDKQTYYRVQLEWIDEQGWKPFLVEQLSDNDRKKQPDTATEEVVETDENRN